MAEIRLDLELGSPPETVWRALTDRDLLDRWFLPGGWALARGAVFALRPAPGSGVTGPVDVEVLDVVPGQRLVMQWTGPTLHTEMTWTLLPGPGGCRLSVVQSGFLGTPQSVRARELRATYWEMFGRQLPSLLRGQTAKSRTDVPASRPAPRRVWPAGTVAGLRAVARAGVGLRDLGGRLCGSGTVAAALGVAVAAALWVSLHPHHAPTLTPAPNPGASVDPFTIGGLPPTLAPAAQNGQRGLPAVSPSAVTGPARGGSTSSNLGATLGDGAATRPATAGGGPAPAPGDNTGHLSGAYQTAKVNGKGNYRGQIALSATGGAVSGWTVVITVPAGAGVNTVTGAAVTHNGATVTFTPSGNAQIAPGESPVIIDFKVLRPAGTTAPLSCTVDGRPCT